MPELPEVETTLRGIEPYILQKKIKKIIVRQESHRWPVPINTLNNKLLGNYFLSIKRRGKYLIIESKEGFLLIHLGMSGCLRIFNKEIQPDKHDHIDIVFGDKSYLRYTDPRRFGSFLWTQSTESHPLLRNLGPEPLGNEFSAEYLFKKSRKRKVPIKNFIMDSKVVVGIGNIYANEALFLSGIKPSKKACVITLSKFEDLTLNIRNLLHKSIEQGGTTLRNFLGGNNNPGYFKQELMVYGRKGKSCFQCSLPLEELRIGQRSSIFCKKCQK